MQVPVNVDAWRWPFRTERVECGECGDTLRVERFTALSELAATLRPSMRRAVVSSAEDASGRPPLPRSMAADPSGPRQPSYRAPGRAPDVVPESRRRPRCGPPVGHTADGPSWICDACGRDWPCPALRAAPTDAARRATLIPEFSRITQRAIRDLRGQPGGPGPVAIVRRFLWFLPLTDEEARAVALRLR